MFQGQRTVKSLRKEQLRGWSLGPSSHLSKGISIFNWSKYGDSFSSDSKVSQANVPRKSLENRNWSNWVLWVRFYCHIINTTYLLCGINFGFQDIFHFPFIPSNFLELTTASLRLSLSHTHTAWLLAIKLFSTCLSSLLSSKTGMCQ